MDFSDFVIATWKWMAGALTTLLIFFHLKHEKKIGDLDQAIPAISKKVNRMETYLCLLLDHQGIKYHKPEGDE